MKKLRAEATALTEYDAVNVELVTLVDIPTRVTVATFGRDSSIGAHPAGVDQIFHVMSGHGWASGADGMRVVLSAGEQVVWAEGEEHAAGSSSGMTAVIIQAEGLAG
jgi:quercetin dioxygenase-like cupin family protein